MLSESAIMGNPFAKTAGWDVKLSLDPGVTGQPSVGLKFRFAKDGTDAKSPDHYNTFAVGWKPGVRVGDQWMMDSCIIQWAKQPATVDVKHTFPPAIQELCKK